MGKTLWVTKSTPHRKWTSTLFTAGYRRVAMVDCTPKRRIKHKPGCSSFAPYESKGGEDPLNSFEGWSKKQSEQLVQRGGNQKGHSNSKAGELCQLWISACIEFDEQSARQILEQAFSQFSVETVCTELLQKGISLIGEGWIQGRITIHQEHFASSLAIRHLEMLIGSSPAPLKTGRILIGCPEAEEHTFMPLLLTLLLRRTGWGIVYLGSNIPIDNLESTMTSIQPDLVILVAQQFHTAANLMTMSESIHARDISFAYGGQIFNALPELIQSISGHYLGANLSVALQTVDQIMVDPLPKSPSYKAPELQAHTLAYYYKKQPQAGLTLGNIDRLGQYGSWMADLLRTHCQLSHTDLCSYLQSYKTAVLRHMGADATPVLRWLTDISNAVCQPN